MTETRKRDPESARYAPTLSYVSADDFRGNAGSTIQLDRDGIADLLGKSHDGERDRWEPLGYQRTIQTEHYRERYERHDIAQKIVDKPPRDTWREPPDIIDDAESEARAESDTTGSTDIESGDETPFETAVNKLFDGDPLRRSLLHRLFTADKLARLFEYSVIVLGTRGKKLSQPLDLPSLQSPDDIDVDDAGESETPAGDRPYAGLSDINYIAVFSQEAVNDVNRVTDLNDERYGLVENYDITVENDDDDSIEIHHTRALHIPGESTDSDDLFSTPVLKPVWNRLEDLEKLLGGGAEMFWRGAYPGIVVSRDPDVVYDDDGDGLAEQIKEYNHDMRRALFPTGADVKTLSPNIGDPSNHIAEHIKMISAAIDIPQNILTGNELGDRASSEDRRTYHEHILSRMRNYAESVILRPVIDRLVDMGIVPAPEGGTYTIEWPALAEPTESERADIAKTRMEALKAATGGRPETLATDAELRKLMFMKPEFGAEAPDAESDLEAPDDLAPPTVDEDNPDVQEQFAQAQDAVPVADGGTDSE